MKSPARPIQAALALALALALTACVGTEPKTLGQKNKTGEGTGTTDSDSFAVTLAYRKDLKMTIQGVRNVTSANLTNVCGSAGASCQCLFYTSSSATPVASVGMSASADHNYVSCNIPAANLNTTFTNVRLRTISGSQSTGFLTVKTPATLTLYDILGDLPKNKINGIYRYTCSRTYFEGEGVTAGAVSCALGQKLGLITAAYSFYAFKSQLDSSNYTGRPQTAVPYDAVCNRANIVRLNCSSSIPSLAFGLFSEPTSTFRLSVALNTKPEGENASVVQGYAALPDSAGECPLGLVKAQPWIAAPQSIIQGSIDGVNPPSSFINADSKLNDIIVDLAQGSFTPAKFNVNRAANTTPCSAADGDCSGASWNSTSIPQQVSYVPTTPVFCVIPKELVAPLL